MWTHTINFTTFAWVWVFMMLCCWCCVDYVRKYREHERMHRVVRCMIKECRRLRLDPDCKWDIEKYF